MKPLVPRRAYPRKADIIRAIEAAKAGGIAVGAVEVGSDGTIRVLSERAGRVENAYDRWKASRAQE